MADNRCVCCGEIIPEGMITCPNCLVVSKKEKSELIDKWEKEKVCTDFIEVVRCKDCIGWCRNVGIKDSPNGHCFTHDIDTNGFDFCSYGERKDK